MNVIIGLPQMKIEINRNSVRMSPPDGMEGLYQYRYNQIRNVWQLVYRIGRRNFPILKNRIMASINIDAFSPTFHIIYNTLYEFGALSLMDVIREYFEYQPLWLNLPLWLVKTNEKNHRLTHYRPTWHPYQEAYLPVYTPEVRLLPSNILDGYRFVYYAGFAHEACVIREITGEYSLELFNPAYGRNITLPIECPLDFTGGSVRVVEE